MQRRQSGSRLRRPSQAWFVTALLLLAFLGVALVNEPDGGGAVAGAGDAGLHEAGFGAEE